MIKKKLLSSGLLLSLLFMVGCDSLPSLNDTFAGRKVDYKKQSRSIDRLEVPPDMNSSRLDDDVMQIPQVASRNKETSGILPQNEISRTVLPAQTNINLMRDEDVRYLVIDAPVELVWTRMREFWLNKGMLIKRENPQTGILETEWAENRADIPQGFIRNALGKVLEGFYSAATRDKYRVRLEHQKGGQVALFLTHYGMQEVIESDRTERVIWTPRPRDAELEAEMLGQMMVFYGMEAGKAKQLLAKKAQQQIDKAVMARDRDGNTLLLVKETYPRAWRRTGVALDRVNFVVEDRDRKQGLFYVSYNDPLADTGDKGFFDKFNFWQQKEEIRTAYRIKLTDQGDNTEVTVLDEQDKRLTSETAKRILTLLYEQLK